MLNDVIQEDFLSFVDTEKVWIVTYPVTGGMAEFTLAKTPRCSSTGASADGVTFLQFVSMVEYNGIPLTRVPFLGGVSGLVLLSSANKTGWSSTVERNDSSELVFLYRNQDYVIRLVFIDGKPLMKIQVDYTAVHSCPSPMIDRSELRWIFWQAIGGEYNTLNRVVVPQGEDKYWVINGQAEGIHYFPSNEYWSLRMGAENSAYQNITMGFVYKDSSMVQKIEEGDKKPDTWGPWAMGQDLYLDKDNQFGSSFDSVPFGLDKIKCDLYFMYQEDEAGLGYSWMDTAGKGIDGMHTGEVYHYEVYFWVGEDQWKGAYGVNKDRDYQFMIDRYQNSLK